MKIPDIYAICRELSNSKIPLDEQAIKAVFRAHDFPIEHGTFAKLHHSITGAYTDRDCLMSITSENLSGRWITTIEYVVWASGVTLTLTAYTHWHDVVISTRVNPTIPFENILPFYHEAHSAVSKYLKQEDNHD